jgi:hypothetical protein
MFSSTHVYKVRLTIKQNAEGSGPLTDGDREFNFERKTEVWSF